MEQFSDFERFLFENDFVERCGEGASRLGPRIFAKKTVQADRAFLRTTCLNDTEAFILDNDFTEENETVNHSHLLNTPLFASQSPSLSTLNNEPESKRVKLNDMEAFILNNDFVEDHTNVDYKHLAANPLFSNTSPLVSHLTCEICNCESETALDFLIHMSECRRKQHRRVRPNKHKRVLRCDFCQFKTKIRVKLEYHKAEHHRCTKCNYIGRGLKKHIQAHQIGYGNNASKPSVHTPLSTNPFKAIKAFKGYVRTYRETGVQDQDSLPGYFHKTKKYVKDRLLESVQDLKVLKAQFSVFVTFRRYLCRSETGKKVYEVINKPMNSRMLVLMNSFGFDDVYAKWCEKISNNIAIFQQYGSGWTFSRVTGADIRIGKLKPQRGGCWASIPKKLRNKQAIININSGDEQCFKWALLLGLHLKDLNYRERQNPHRLSNYKKYEDLYDFSSLQFPVEVSQIPKFEKQSDLAINVFSYDWQDGVLPVYISKNIYKGMPTVDLLLLPRDEASHYVAITDIHKLLGKKNCHRRLLCYHCLNTFEPCKTNCNSSCNKECRLLKHISNCMEFKFQRIKMPKVDKEGNTPQIKFTNFQNQLKKGFVVYADFESLLIPEADEDSAEISESESYTAKQQCHIPCGFSYVVVDSAGKMVDGRVYRGEDSVDQFLIDMQSIRDRVSEIYTDEIQPMKLTPQQKAQFKMETYCHICERSLRNEDNEDDRVRDHDHLTGLYRGAAHWQCNALYSQNHKLPVLLHNFRGYDSHFIIKGFNKFGDKVSVIPTNSEQFMSVTVDGIVFIDSLQFLNAKLETLVKNLVKDGNDQKNFPLLHQLFEDQESIDLLKQKGVYPYDYFDSWSVFEEKTLPPIEEFHNKLRDEALSAEHYKQAERVFNHFECRNLGDYHDLYLMTDTLLLASVFEGFREMSLNTYKLDPVHYISAPGLAWDAALRMTRVELDLLTDIDHYEFLESGLKGGVSMIVQRKSEANNKYMESYEGDEESENQKYIISWDMNNLYGKAMQQPLPVKNFAWLSEHGIKDMYHKIMNISDNAEVGYILECDLDYKESVHSLHNDYPLAPERTSIPLEKLSEYQKGLVEELGIKYSDTQTKLIPHLGPRKKYKVHYRNLKYYLENGMILKKIHRVLAFEQQPWLAPYIDFNTQKRANATNKFETDFFKLMNNSVYGKGMENVRKRMSVRLVNKWEQAMRLIIKPQYITHDVLCNNLCSFRMENGIVTLNKAVYTGFAVLDLSKLFMYKFHYDYVKRKYGSRAKLLFTDTDSLTYEVVTRDIYEDMLEDINLFDTSDYPQTHFLQNSQNKKVIGKMHDEANGDIVFKFVGLAPKVYCMVIGEKDKSYEKKALKGVPKYLQDSTFRYDKYVEVLSEEKRVHCKWKQIRSFKHKICTVEVCKSVLHGFDSKRFILDDGVSTLAWGHKLLKRWVSC